MIVVVTGGWKKLIGRRREGWGGKWRKSLSPKIYGYFSELGDSSSSSTIERIHRQDIANAPDIDDCESMAQVFL
ncbi:hypothetical protein CEXT_694491 [Caerostris extrusa]|uniref:Uncharacterized protein n=1 Tax=Caerostris extrusa TaxID=172846 RepID=A0AAV4T0V1_CAEEX|nr:hypothetical protein CEXT_694491 [Caerostris extrusa]